MNNPMSQKFTTRSNTIIPAVVVVGTPILQKPLGDNWWFGFL